MWAAQFYKFKRARQFMTSGGLGVMGYGFPAAMGVQVAKPDSVVIDIAGDGSIQMNIQELITVVANNLPVKIAILNNNFLGMVRQWQQLLYERRYSSTALWRPAGFRQAGRGLTAPWGSGPPNPMKWKRSSSQALETPRPVIMDFGWTGKNACFPWCPRVKPPTKCFWHKERCDESHQTCQAAYHFGLGGQPAGGALPGHRPV